MKVVLLTSSRADYSIYYPLLTKLKNDPAFDLSIIAFGTHLSEKHGYTVNHIEADGFVVSQKVNTLPTGDSPFDISSSIGQCMVQFAAIWKELADQTDLIICLGDRYEMFAAIAASVPFNIPVAHIHGGEKTAGAIDDVYRHSLTHMASYHFASTKKHAERIAQLKNNTQQVYQFGSLSIENIRHINFLNAEQFEAKFGVPINRPVLVTFHPETVEHKKNNAYAIELVKALSQIKEQIIITLPNNDTMGNSIREHLLNFAKNRSHVYTVDSLGMQGYYSCLQLCQFVLGNSSSGIIEAASFGKYVLDIGDRQKGRDAGANVIHCEINAEAILKQIERIASLPPLGNENIYEGKDVSNNMIQVFKSLIKH